MAVPYNHRAIEQKWRKNWEEHPVNVNDGKKPKYYCLDMFPYPSGSGLHVGHWRGYVISDVWSRYKMLQGYYLIHPMGWDAFGLPAENYAIKMGVHPAKSTAENISNIKRQIDVYKRQFQTKRTGDYTYLSDYLPVGDYRLVEISCPGYTLAADVDFSIAAGKITGCLLYTSQAVIYDLVNTARLNYQLLGQNPAQKESQASLQLGEKEPEGGSTSITVCLLYTSRCV